MIGLPAGTRVWLAADTTALLAVIKALQHENAYLRLQLAKARRERFGRSSERAGDLLNQLPLGFADEASASGHDRGSDLKNPIIAKCKRKLQRQSLPDFLPREEQVLAANDSCGCPACGGALKFLGQDVSETLEFVPASFKVIRTVRPKLACGRCDTIVQAPAPSRPIARGLAGPGLLAQVLVAKYCDHQPLYRQSAILMATSFTLTIRRFRYWPLAVEKHELHGCGPTFAMTVQPGLNNLRRFGSLIHLIAKVSTHKSI